MILVLVAGFTLSLLRPSILQIRPRGRLLDGEWTSGFQRGYEQDLFLRQFAVYAWGAIRFGLFREGRAGVLVGEDGWLFTTEEFAASSDEGPALDAALERVRRVRGELSGRGTGLMVALVPSKARLYPDKLGRYRFPARAEERYERFRRGLLALGISAPDLTAPLREARSGGEVFLRTDTHWNAHGARAAAAVLAAAGRPVLDRHGSPPVDFRTRPVGSRRRPGDLLNFIPLGPWQSVLGPRPDRVREYETEQREAGRLGLFDAVEIPVALVGTSYSSGRLWNFDGALKELLGADVLNVAEEGLGPLAPMRAYLRSDTIRDIPPALVIWEIPERTILTLAAE